MLIEEFSLRLESDPLLTQKLEPFDFSQGLDAHAIENRMTELMKDNYGIGIAANQVGFDRRVIIVKPRDSDPIGMFNPEVIDSDGKFTDTEGCLSFPGLFINVERFENITVKYLDKNNKTCTITLTGMDAKCVQHEIDHLDGICFISRVSKLKLDLARKRQRKYNGRAK
jgi:peptide deformylase